MKKIALLSALALSGLFYNSASAQILQVGVQFGGGRGPVVQASVSTPVTAVAYADNYDDYYYLPEVDAYYSVADEEYYYNDGITWVSAPYLPGAYRNYNWRNVRRYEVHAYRPYLNHSVYRNKYRGNDFNWGRYERNSMARRYDNRVERPRNDNRYNSRPESRNDNRVYNRPDTRNDNRGYNPRGGEHAQGNYGRGNDRNDNRNQGGYGQGRDNNDRQQGRGNDNRGGQPSRNGGGRDNNRGGGETHFTSNQGQGSHGRARS